MKTIEEYAELFERMGLNELYVEENGNKLRLRKEAPVPPGMPVVPGFTPKGPNTDIPVPAAEGFVKQERAEEPAPPEKDEQAEGETVTAPLLGIFHAAIGGVTKGVGDSVRKGDALCAIEAMKMMNEVTAPCDGVIREILANDGALVEYHQPLFVIGK